MCRALSKLKRVKIEKVCEKVSDDDCDWLGIRLRGDDASYIFHYGGSKYGIYLVNKQKTAQKLKGFCDVNFGDGESIAYFTLEQFPQVRKIVHPRTR
jgi:hypothetical protein